jgi:Na+-translocating ferredoxin:NAD+ oxidoreductase RnfG subunit
MRKVLIRLAFIVTVIASLSLLVFINSCAAPDSLSRIDEKITTAGQNSPSAQINSEVLALRKVFPTATEIAEIQISQNTQIHEHLDDAKISEIKDSSGTAGYIVDFKVVSRSGPFKIRVLLDNRLYIKQAAVISYPWDRGRDVCKRTFTSQFEDKSPNDPIQVGKDIDAVTGATISCRVMTEGVRNSIRLLKTKLLTDE